MSSMVPVKKRNIQEVSDEQYDTEEDEDVQRLAQIRKIDPLPVHVDLTTEPEPGPEPGHLGEADLSVDSFINSAALKMVEERLRSDYQTQFENMMEDVRCNYCLEPMDVPVTLHCGHGGCKLCVEKWVNISPEHVCDNRCKHKCKECDKLS